MNPLDTLAQPDPTATIIKRGELCVQFTMHRNLSHAKEGVGLSLSIKTHRVVEEFMRQMAGDNQPMEVKTSQGRYWVGLTPERPLLAYRFQEKIPCVEADDADVGCYSFDHLGYPLSVVNDRFRKPFLNLSFLRLVGISEGAGITFGIKGVYSYDSLKTISDDLATASRRFYTRYLKPVDLTVMVSTQEMNT